jgi:hypothetical protein
MVVSVVAVGRMVCVYSLTQSAEGCASRVAHSMSLMKQKHRFVLMLGLWALFVMQRSTDYSFYNLYTTY